VDEIEEAEEWKELDESVEIGFPYATN